MRDHPSRRARFHSAQAAGAGSSDDDFATVLLERARRSGYRIEPEGVPVGDGLAPGGAY